MGSLLRSLPALGPNPGQPAATTGPDGGDPQVQPMISIQRSADRRVIGGLPEHPLNILL